LSRKITAILRVKNQAGVYCYIEGYYEGRNDADMDVLSFTLDTDYDIDASNYIGTTSMALVNVGAVMDKSYNKVPLQGEWDFLFFVRQDYIPDSEASRIQIAGIPKAITDQNMIFVAQQKAEITFGEAIPALRNNIFVSAEGLEYKSHTTTTFATYNTETYRRWDDPNKSVDLQKVPEGEDVETYRALGYDVDTETSGGPYVVVPFAPGDLWYNVRYEKHRCNVSAGRCRVLRGGRAV
jgi:hypothetical protein